MSVAMTELDYVSETAIGVYLRTMIYFCNLPNARWMIWMLRMVYIISYIILDINDMKGNQIRQNEITTSMSKWRIWARCWGVNSFESLGRMLEWGQPPVCQSIVNPLSRSGSADMNKWHGVQGCKQKEACSPGSVMRMLAAKNYGTTRHDIAPFLTFVWLGLGAGLVHSWSAFALQQHTDSSFTRRTVRGGRGPSAKTGKGKSSVSLPWPLMSANCAWLRVKTFLHLNPSWLLGGFWIARLDAEIGWSSGRSPFTVPYSNLMSKYLVASLNCPSILGNRNHTEHGAPIELGVSHVMHWNTLLPQEIHSLHQHAWKLLKSLSSWSDWISSSPVSVLQSWFQQVGLKCECTWKPCNRDLVIQEIRALSSILFYVAYDLCFDRGILGIGTSKDHLRSIAVSILEHDESMRHSRCHSSTCFTQACINLCKSYEISNRSLLG